MKVKDVMTRGVISVEPETPALRAAELMLQYDISGFPVIGQGGKLVGIVTEGDFLRRAESGTERRRERWLALLLGPGRLAEEYMRAHGRTVAQVMTTDVVTVAEDAPLERVVELMEAHHIKRVPVVRGDYVVGIVSRRDLLHAYAARARRAGTPARRGDEAIHQQILAEFKKEAWVPKAAIAMSVSDGVVELRGTVGDERQRQALRVLIGNVPGVKEVRDALVRVDPNAAPQI